MTERPVLIDDQMCFVCGKKNLLGFRLDFEHPSKGCLLAAVVFKKEHQGYEGIVHGGLVSTLLDEMMVNLAWKESMPAVTAEMTVRLKKAVPVGQTIHFEGRIDRETARILHCAASAASSDGEIYATATAKCVRIAPQVNPCLAHNPE